MISSIQLLAKPHDLGEAWLMNLDHNIPADMTPVHLTVTHEYDQKNFNFFTWASDTFPTSSSIQTHLLTMTRTRPITKDHKACI